MALLPIVQEGAPVLRQRALPVKRITKRLERLVDDMFETMREADGVGLAAPQVGVSERLIVIDVGEGEVALFNPVIVEARGHDTDLEGCLSIPGKVGYVTRAEEVVAQGLNRHGRPTEVRAAGLLARALQHEIDHLDGILFIDRATEVHEKKA
ncbi:MAG: peptide deformylase [Chitinophagales bacterium]